MTQSHQGQGETVVSGASRPLSIPTLLRCCRVLVMETGNYRSPWWCQHWGLPEAPGTEDTPTGLWHLLSATKAGSRSPLQALLQS